MTVMASSSRGDYVALIAALLWLALAAKGRRLVAGFLVIFILGIGYWAMPTEMIERFSVAGDEDDYTSYTRETRWKAGFEIFQEHPVFGVGTGSWVTYYMRYYPREEGREGWGLPHNSFIEVIGDHGSIGLLSMILIFGGMFCLINAPVIWQVAIMIRFHSGLSVDLMRRLSLTLLVVRLCLFFITPMSGCMQQ